MGGIKFRRGEVQRHGSRQREYIELQAGLREREKMAERLRRGVSLVNVELADEPVHRHQGWTALCSV